MRTPTAFRHAALAAVAVLALGTLLSLAAQAQAPPGQPEFAPGQVIVQFKDGTSPAARQDALKAVSALSSQQLAWRSSTADVEQVATPLSVPVAIQALSRHPAVAFAEPNWIVHHQAVINDPGYTLGYLWGMYGPKTAPANSFGTNAGAAWGTGHTGSASVYVGVIDEGINFSQPDLGANVWTNPFDPPNGKDDDGNGFVDDVHGWDFYSRDNTIYDGMPGDGIDGHGTHVSGTIGAVGGNGMGVAGMCWKVKIISAKFLGPYGGYISDAISATDYLTDLKKRHGLNIVAINNSWGGGGYSQALNDAIIRAAKANILFVVAAGNYGVNNDSYGVYPANYDTTTGTSTEKGAGYNAVIAVAAIDSTGALASFSDWGAKTVHLGAPGVNVLSTYPGGYAYMSGTSMATPHVTGAVALYASTHPGSSAYQIRNAILSAAKATITPSLTGKTTTGGRLNVTGF